MKFPCKLPPGRETDPEFLGCVDGWVANATEKRPRVGDFLALLPGVWPVEVVASIRRLVDQGKVPEGFGLSVENFLRQRRRRHREQESAKAPDQFLEHPLDFEWRFTNAGQGEILRELQGVCRGVSGTVLCLGCPTLFSRGKEMLPEQRFVLWDKNASSLGQIDEAHSLLDVDLRYEHLPGESSVAAVLDPPWYNDFYRLFLWAALRNVVVGGHILLSFPPEGTRPSAARDRSDIIRWAEEAGAELLSHRRDCLPYRSPLFEVNALAAAGMGSVPIDWRRGDLLIFRRKTSVFVERPIVPKLDDQWIEHRFGSVRLRIRVGDEAPDARAVRPVGRGAVLPSVSTRFPKRNLANVVTSGNRFLQVSSSDRMSEICHELKSSPGKTCRLAGVSTASDILRESNRLRRVISVERREAAEYFAYVDGL